MTLQRGCRLAVAPHFHVEPDWPARLQLGQGVFEADGRFFPRLPWRPPSAQELTLLTDGPDRGGLDLFRLPDHLRTAWWQLLEQAGDTQPLPGFGGYLGRIVEFLAFKQMQPPAGLWAEAMVGRPGQPSLRWDAEAGCLAGLAPSVDAAVAMPLPPDPPRLWAAVNLGDEATALVYLNRDCAGQLEDLRRHGTQSLPTTVGELARRWLWAAADIPPVRIRLEPGEGLRLPDGGVVCDGCPEDKREPDVWLMVSVGATVLPASR